MVFPAAFTVGGSIVNEKEIGPCALTIGGQSSQAAFAGLAPEFVGLYQINTEVPKGVTPGSIVPVVLSVAGQQSTPVTINLQ